MSENQVIAEIIQEFIASVKTENTSRDYKDNYGNGFDKENDGIQSNQEKKESLNKNRES